MKLFIFFLVGLLGIAQAAWSQEEIYDFSFWGSSSVPAEHLPKMVPLFKLKKDNGEIPKIRVLIFPHTLSSDWVHGSKDDASEVELRSSFPFKLKSIDGVLLETRWAHFQYLDSGELLVQDYASKDSQEIKIQGVWLDTEFPVEVYRKKNSSKSHSYIGRLELLAKSGEVKVINELDMESYLRGVVPREAVKTWPLEALKTQAVAARTYAFYHYLTASSTRLYHVDDTVRYQVFGGVSSAADSTDEAIEQTKGEILTYNNNVIVAYFHAYSGGRTDSAENIFSQKDAPYCKGVLEIFPKEELKAELSPKAHWIVDWSTKKFSDEDLISRFKKSSYTKSKFVNFDPQGELYMQRLVENEGFDSAKIIRFFQGNEFADVNFFKIRYALGTSNFPAYHFNFVREDGETSFAGSGWGHHVGMCQWGAFVMAKNYDKKYDQILSHYYFDTQLRAMY